MTSILIVDDEVDIATTLRKGLERSGFQVDSYSDPLKAIEEFQPGKYDLMLIDVKMPRIDGFQLYETLSKIDSAVKVCFLTAFDIGYVDVFKKRFPHLQTDWFIKKPVSIQTLITKVKGQLDLLAH